MQERPEIRILLILLATLAFSGCGLLKKKAAIVKQVSAGGGHTCVVLKSNTVRCWGSNTYGELGHSGNSAHVNVGGTVKQISAGGSHTCAVFAPGKVRCWGWNKYGQLGYGHTQNIGDDETPSSVDAVEVGARVKSVSTGGLFTCALLETGRVRCWGWNGYQALGYGHTELIGDNEDPAREGDVNVGGKVKQITTGGHHICALLETGRVRCWGENIQGQLGHGNTKRLKEYKTPADTGYVGVGGKTKQITAGNSHTCALLETGRVRCWGNNFKGKLGYGHTRNIGDKSSPGRAGDVNVGGKAKQITAGWHHSCVLLENGKVRCWGSNKYGQLGYGHTQNIGDDETPASAGDVNLGGKAKYITAGDFHTCALLETDKIRCWGRNQSGELGYRHTQNIGDNESPAGAGDVDL